MRTTVTLDSDVNKMLHDLMHRTHKSFKEALNAAIRAGLSEQSPPSDRKPFKVKGRSLGLRSEVEGVNFNRLAAELEDEAVVQKLRRQHGK
jgi:hypothetical protein